MSTISRPEREEQALREVGRTEISRPTAALLTLLLLATVAAVPLLQGVDDLRAARGAGEPTAPGARVASLFAELPATARVAAGEGPLAANLHLRRAIERFETAVEDASVLRRWLLPPTQAALTGLLGAGNEQAYPGRERGWLFYRADFDHVTGPGFFEPSFQRRRVAADPGEAPPHPDPLPAILALDADLAARGVELVLLPVPVKPSIHPEKLTSRVAPGRAVPNPSWHELLRRVEAAGVQVFDAWTPLVGDGDGEPRYLRADTHWTPAGMEAVAEALAAWLDRRIEWRHDPERGYRRRPAAVVGQGDIAAMLRLPDPARLFPSQRVEASRVLGPDGRPWRADRAAEILLLGDSFTNVYSDAALGWGSGAGLAELLSLHLGRPVDRIALNAGGAWASRQALARALAQGPGRLDGKRVVVYQFATRELSSGDWRPVPLPPGG